MGVTFRKKGRHWYVFINHCGQRKAKKVGSREAAEKVKREIEARLALGDFGVVAEPDCPTFTEYSKRWLRLHVKPNCKLSTSISYKQVLDRYLVPHFGDTRLDQITRDKVKTYFSETVAEEKFGHGTLKNMLATIMTILSHAVEDGLVVSNPALRLGKVAFRKAPKRAADFLTRSEAQRFLQKAHLLKPERYPLFLTALRAGLRLGELLALEWRDIQFGESEDNSNRFIIVRHNFTRGQFTTTKSRKERRVDLSKELRRGLLELRDKRILAAVSRGNFDESHQPRLSKLVFPSETGGPINGSNVFNRDFLPLLEAEGIRRVTFHALRHTFASLLIQQGASLAYVKEQMGHSSIQVTVDIYGHLIPGGNIGWVDALDKETTPGQSATPAQPPTPRPSSVSPQLIEMIGGPSRTRTCDQRIMSPLL